MLSSHELGYVTRRTPAMRRASRSAGGARTVGVRVVPRSVAVPRSETGPTRGRILIKYAAAMLYGVPFYGVSCATLAWAVLRHRQRQAARHAMRYAAVAAGGLGADHGGRHMPG